MLPLGGLEAESRILPEQLHITCNVVQNFRKEKLYEN